MDELDPAPSPEPLSPELLDTLNPVPAMRRSDARHPDFPRYVSSGDKAREVKQLMLRPAHGRGMTTDTWWFHYLCQTSGGVNVCLRPYTSTRYVGLHPIRVPVDQRGHGIGTAVMQAVCEVADSRDWTLVIARMMIFRHLTDPALRDWYRRFGFRQESGSHHDSIRRGALVRDPVRDEPVERVRMGAIM